MGLLLMGSRVSACSIGVSISSRRVLGLGTWLVGSHNHLSSLLVKFHLLGVVSAIDGLGSNWMRLGNIPVSRYSRRRSVHWLWDILGHSLFVGISVCRSL